MNTRSDKISPKLVKLPANNIDSSLCSVTSGDIKNEFFPCGTKVKIKSRSDKQLGNRI